MTDIITDIEDAFEGIGSWLGNIEATASSIISNVKADINYLVTSAPAIEKWFDSQIQTIYNNVQGILSLAESAIQSASAAVTTIYNAAKAALAALVSYFETTGSQAPGGISAV